MVVVLLALAAVVGWRRYSSPRVVRERVSWPGWIADHDGRGLQMAGARGRMTSLDQLVCESIMEVRPTLDGGLERHGKMEVYLNDPSDPPRRLMHRSSWWNGVMHGEMVDYLPDGSVVAEGRFDHGVRVGRWRQVSMPSRAMLEETFRSGKRHGPAMRVSPLGFVEHSEFKDGKADGDFFRVAPERPGDSVPPL